MATVEPWSRPYEVEDLEEMPDDGHRRELVDGVLVVTPAPGAAHQDAVLSLGILLRAAIASDQRVFVAPFDWVAGPRTLFEPDILVARRGDVGPARLERPPLLVVEVLSPSTRLVDLNLKRAAYAAAGVPAYWIVDPVQPRLTVLRLDGDTYAEEASVTGDDAYRASFPCAVTVVPSLLLDT